jgi:hypothetical protein
MNFRTVTSGCCSVKIIIERNGRIPVTLHKLEAGELALDFMVVQVEGEDYVIDEPATEASQLKKYEHKR